MAYYYHAVSFDPKLSEASGRLSTLSSTISSGNIGENVRNDIQRRNEWVKILTEAEDFFSRHLPFEIVYSAYVNQGKIDYAKDTVELTSSITLKPSNSFKVFNDILKGLEATGKMEEWGLTFWPAIPVLSSRRWSLENGLQGPLFSQKGFTEYYPRSYDVRDSAEKDIVAAIVLLNENGIIISKADMALNSKIRFELKGTGRIDRGSQGNWLLQRPYWYEVDATKPEATVDQKEIRFIVNANDITDNLTVKIASVNGIDIAKNTDYVRITAK
jgi:hypothetical protein